MQCLFMEVQGCRFTALKTAQTVLQLLVAAANLSWAVGHLSCSSNKALRRVSGLLCRFQAAVQCLFMEVQGCRLTALKTAQTLLQLLVAAAGSVSFHGGPRLPCNVFLWRFKAAVSQP